MSSFLSELGGITGGVGSEALAFAAGFAAAHALEPEAVTIKQDAWKGAPVLRLPPEVAAAAAAENYASYDNMAAEAAYYGWAQDRFAYLYDVTVTAPGMGELLAMLRRGTINPGNFTHGLRKAKLEPMWDDALTELRNARIDPAVIAVAIQRGIMSDPGFLPVDPPSGVGNVPAFPVSKIDPLTEAAAAGWDADRLFVETAIQGLPISLIQGAQGYFRGILELDDYYRAVSEGNTRNEWRDAILETSRQILSANQYSELELRGYYDRATRLKNTAKHGMTTADSDLLYDVLGRGLSLHAAFIAERRGGVFEGPTDAIPDYAMFALQRGNLRPEVYNQAWAARETYPSYFVTRALLQDGVITSARGTELFLGLGWPEDVAKDAGAAFGTSTTAAAIDPHVKKAQTTLYTEAHKAYVKTGLSQAQVMPALNALAVPATAQGEVFKLWDVEKQLAAEVPA